jgi:hypothetical protein
VKRGTLACETMAKSLLTFRSIARAPIQGVLSRLLQLQLPAPVQRFAQGTMRRVLREFPLLGELLELSRVVIERAAGNGVVSAPVTVAAVAAVPTSKPVAPAVVSAAGVAGVAAAVTPVSAVAPSNGAGKLASSARDRLLAELRGPSAEAALAAVEAMAASGDPQAYETLLATLRNTDGYFHPLVRVAAMRALADDRSEAVRAAIVASIDSVSAEVSLAAIAALTQYPPELALAPIKRVVEDRSGYFAPEVRAAAERALDRLGN